MNKQTDFEKVYEILTGKVESLEMLILHSIKCNDIGHNLYFTNDEYYSIEDYHYPFYLIAFDFNKEGKCEYATLGFGELSESPDLVVNFGDHVFSGVEVNQISVLVDPLHCPPVSGHEARVWVLVLQDVCRPQVNDGLCFG